MSQDSAFASGHVSIPQDVLLQIEDMLKVGNILSAVGIAASVVEIKKGAQALPSSLIERLTKSVGPYAWNLVKNECLYNDETFSMEDLASLKEAFSKIGDFDAVTKAYGDQNGLKEKLVNSVAVAACQIMGSRVYWDDIPSARTLEKRAYNRSVDNRSWRFRPVSWPKRWETSQALLKIEGTTKLIGIEGFFDRPDVLQAFSDRMRRLGEYPKLFAVDLYLMQSIATGYPQLRDKIHNSPGLAYACENVISHFPDEIGAMPLFLERTKDGFSLYRGEDEKKLYEAIQDCSDNLSADGSPPFAKTQDIIGVTVVAALRGWPVQTQLGMLRSLLETCSEKTKAKYPQRFAELFSALDTVPQDTDPPSAPTAPETTWLARMTRKLLRNREP